MNFQCTKVYLEFFKILIRNLIILIIIKFEKYKIYFFFALVLPASFVIFFFFSDLGSSSLFYKYIIYLIINFKIYFHTFLFPVTVGVGSGLALKKESSLD